MATAMVMQMRRNAGFMFRETGQAFERLGMSMMGDYSYMEPRACSPPPFPAVLLRLGSLLPHPLRAGRRGRCPCARGGCSPWGGRGLGALDGSLGGGGVRPLRPFAASPAPPKLSWRQLTSPCAWHCAVSRHRKVMGVHDTYPIVGAGVFVAPNASVIGDVTLGSGSSVWYGAILRGARRLRLLSPVAIPAAGTAPTPCCVPVRVPWWPGRLASG